MPTAYRSFKEQSLHYFSREHQLDQIQTIDSPAAWKGGDMPGLEQMAFVLNDQHVEEIEAAIISAKQTQKLTQHLTAADFPLPTLQSSIAHWRQALGQGIGFQVVRGVPVQRWSQSDAELFFWCLGLHLGIPGAQNPQGDLLGHVIDTQQNADEVRLYQTNANIAYHCDAADVVGLLCLKKAKAGGHSRIVSSVSVFNELVQQYPELVSRLYQPFYLDARDKAKDGSTALPAITPCCFSDGVLKTFYHSDYFRSAPRHPQVADFTSQEQKLLDCYEDIANHPDFYLDMDLQPGDIQLLSNHSNLHARTEYQDHVQSKQRRHLLRLWLSI